MVKEIRGWVLTILAVLAFRTFLYEAVYIPSGSMIPTLQIGDYVIVEKWAYNARLPFTESAQLNWASPRRGDIVVLLAPPGNARGDDLIKRVVGVSGDTIEIRAGGLVVNGEAVPRERQPDSCSYWSKEEGTPWRQADCIDFVETLGEHRYHTYCSPEVPCDPPFPYAGPQKVPPGHVWLAGDHRDHSSDSRAFGPVPIRRIKGRAFVALASWGPKGPRWDRLFHRISH